MSNTRRFPSGYARKTDNSVTALALDEMQAQPHFEVTLTTRTNMETITDTLLEACSGLFPGERPTILVDSRQCLALISVSEHQVERLQYKSWIEHRPTSTRYPCRFCEGTLGVPQKRASVKLLGAKFAFLKSQQHVRDHLKKCEPLIRANWQQCTGAEFCFVHLHYSSEEPALLEAVDELRNFLEEEASHVLLESLPLHVPPCDRYALSIDNGFRAVAYDHNVSPWTRTQRDSPLGPEWCTFATDTAEKMSATIEAYKEFARSNRSKFNLKVLSDTKMSPPTARGGNRKMARSSASGASSPSASSTSPSNNSPVESLEFPMSPVMTGPTHNYQDSSYNNGFHPAPTVSAAKSHNTYGGQNKNRGPQDSNFGGFGPRRDRNAAARSITPNDAAPLQYSPPSPTPLLNVNAPSDLPPGLNLAAPAAHISNPHMSLPFGFVMPPTTTFHSLMPGFDPLRFPSNAVPFHMPSAPLAATEPSFDDVWGKYSPPSESFIPSIASSGAVTSDPALSFSDFFINPTEQNRYLSLTDSTGLSG